MGFRDHLPNYRYLSFIELNVTRWVKACCHEKGIKPLNWVIAMQEMIEDQCSHYMWGYRRFKRIPNLGNPYRADRSKLQAFLKSAKDKRYKT